jgi:hypothetical protein
MRAAAGESAEGVAVASRAGKGGGCGVVVLSNQQPRELLSVPNC